MGLLIEMNNNYYGVHEPQEHETVSKPNHIRFYNPSNLFAYVRLAYTHHVTEYSPAKTGEHLRIFPNFQNCAHCEKDLKDNKDNI